MGLQLCVPLHHDGNVKSCSHSGSNGDHPFPVEPGGWLAVGLLGCWVGIYLALSRDSSQALGNHPKHVSTEQRGAAHNGNFAAKLNFNAIQCSAVQCSAVPDTSSCKWGLILLPCEATSGGGNIIKSVFKADPFGQVLVGQRTNGRKITFRLGQVCQVHLEKGAFSKW